MQSNHYYDDACWLFLYFAIITSDILDALRILAQYIHFWHALFKSTTEQSLTSYLPAIKICYYVSAIFAKSPRGATRCNMFTHVHGQHTKLVNIKICLKNVGIYIINKD